MSTMHCHFKLAQSHFHLIMYYYFLVHLQCTGYTILYT